MALIIEHRNSNFFPVADQSFVLIWFSTCSVDFYAKVIQVLFKSYETEYCLHHPLRNCAPDSNHSIGGGEKIFLWSVMNLYPLVLDTSAF